MFLITPARFVSCDEFLSGLLEGDSFGVFYSLLYPTLATQFDRVDAFPNQLSVFGRLVACLGKRNGVERAEPKLSDAPADRVLKNPGLGLPF
jgi:hypothetical protein